MPTRMLTVKAIEALEPSDGAPYEIQDAGVDVPGLFCKLLLRVGKRRKTWVLYYRAPSGQRRRKNLAAYGGTNGLGLKAAREQALDCASQLARRQDPLGPGRAINSARTFDHCAQLYFEHISTKDEFGVPRRRSWKNQRYLITKEAIPVWRDRDIFEITAEDALDLLIPIEERAPTLAYQFRSHLGQMWTFLMRHVMRRELRVNPFKSIEVGHPGQRRDVFLAPEQIVNVWSVLECDIDGALAGEHKADRGVRAAAIELGMLTGLRRAEILKSKWSEIQGQWLEVPGLRFDKETWIGGTKPARLTDVYLGSTLGQRWITRLRQVHLVGGLDADWLFPSPKTKRWRKDFAGHVWVRLHRLTGVPHLRWHILRHTFATLVEELGYDELEIGRVLNHAVTPQAARSRAAQTTSGYIHPRRNKIRSKVKPVYRDWHRYLCDLCGVAAPADVSSE